MSLRRATSGVLVAAAILTASCDRDGRRSEPAGEATTTTTTTVAHRVPASQFPERGGSEEAGPGPDVALLRLPASYRITGRIEGRSERDVVTVRTEVNEVRRPWNSRLERRVDGTDTGGSSEIGRFGRRRIGPLAKPLVLALPPSLAPSDLRFDHALDEALAAGLVERRERRTVAGRICQILRSKSTLAAAVLEPATPDEHADSCVDEAGLLLEEVLFLDGRMTLRTVAVKVEEDVALADDLFALADDPVPVREGGGSIRRLEPGTGSPDGGYGLANDPPGYRHRGRYSVVPPQGENFSDPLKAAQRTAGVADVWERGVDVIVLEQGATLQGVPAFAAPDDGARVLDLGDLGRGEVVVSFRSIEIRVLRPDGRYIRIYGTRPVAELEAFLRALQPVPPGALVFSEEPL